MRLDAKTMRTLQAVSGFGCSIAFCLVASIAAGSWADQRLHTKHILVLVGIVVGLVGAGAITYNLAASLSDRKAKDDGGDKPSNPNDGG
jgi:hypothetical protein